MPPNSDVEILTLDRIYSISTANVSTAPEKVCHTFGILKQEDTESGQTNQWTIIDETCLPAGVRVKLCGELSTYPPAKPGDIVRIHRLSFDRYTKGPVALNGKNVVVWRAFIKDPTPLTCARSPTITDDDNQRRKKLEEFYYSLINKIKEVQTSQNSNQQFFRVAGRVKEPVVINMFGVAIVTVNDGTGNIELKVYPKKTAFDTLIHFEVACKLNVGDYIVATNLKIDKEALHLSANTKYGKSIRVVDRGSIFGSILAASLIEFDKSKQKETATNTTEVQTMTAQLQQEPIPEKRPVRRSPRFQQSQDQSQEQSPTCVETSVNSSNHSQETSYSSTSEEEQFPQFTRIEAIKRDSSSKFYFVDLAGQVRGAPKEADAYKNWVFLIYDGSKPEFACFHAALFLDNFEEDSIPIFVYSCQNPGETTKHIETTMKLKDGDLVFLKNVKVSWPDGKLKFEMSARLTHGKSIDVIDRTSKFGIILNEIVTNPLVEELREDYSTPLDESF